MNIPILVNTAAANSGDTGNHTFFLTLALLLTILLLNRIVPQAGPGRTFSFAHGVKDSGGIQRSVLITLLVSLLILGIAIALFVAVLNKQG